MNMVVGHHDEADLRRALGTLSGLVVVVDTPIALSLLAEPNVVENTERVLIQRSNGVDLRFGPSLANEIKTSVRYLGDTTLRDEVDDHLIIDEIGRVVDLIDGDGILSSYVSGSTADGSRIGTRSSTTLLGSRPGYGKSRQVNRVPRRRKRRRTHLSRRSQPDDRAVGGQGAGNAGGEG